MNSEDTGGEKGKKEFLREGLNLTPGNSGSSEKLSCFLMEKRGKRGMKLLRTKIKSKSTLGSGSTYDQCFSGSNFASQYEDECPVNYSLKYSETESCKGVAKSETGKKKFKDFVDYAETDLDQPTDFSLKYAEKTYDEENKNSFSYYNNHRVKFKEYTDTYVETDLDQPTDFTLKYRESAEEEVNFYENEEQKVSSGFGPRIMPSDGASSERMPGRYASQNETPLMFSRSSSMNSLSSFVHITQSIPDDRSSVVSDFSRMTSGIISPSELPDSPTQTAPSSPKRHKLSLAFPPKSDFMTKQSVFEDDVATYKQEGTPIEFSRATSLSSLNIDNPVKSELLIKRNSTSLLAPKEENSNPTDHVDSEHLKHQVVPDKNEHEKGKFELASVLEVDESLFADCISIDIQINCRKSQVVPQENNTHFRQINGFPVKPNFRLRFNNENKKGYSIYEGSDDAVHTYHTEGTPANVSHAGSHSDLSALSISSGIPLSGVDDNFDGEPFFPEDAQTVPAVKSEGLKNNVKLCNGSQPVAINMKKGVERDVYVNDQSQLDYLGKDQHQFTAKDETATFATENSPCDISVRSSLSDLTVNVVEGNLSINRVETCEEPPSQLLSPLRNVSPQSPNSIIFEEAEDSEKCSEDQQNEFLSSESADPSSEGWNCSAESGEKPDSELLKTEESSQPHSVTESDHSNFDFDSTQPLTPFEEALVEECIRLGMPQRKNLNPLQGMHLKSDDDGKAPENRESECTFAKSDFERSKYLNGKKILSDSLISEVKNNLNADNFDFDSSEPLTPFEEVLLEQCIRLGMPQKKFCKKVEGTHSAYSNGVLGIENFECSPTELITPLETVLLEQCIRLGMPQKKIQRKEGIPSSDEPHRGISCLTAHLSRLKLNSENEKDKDGLKKCENCPCGKRHSNRRKNAGCKKIKNRLDYQHS